MSSNNVTMHTVAAVAGVSTKTVSRVINGEPRVKPETKEKVLEVIKLLNFRPTRAARQLRSSKNYSIAVVYEPPGTEFLNGIIEAVLPVCHDRNYHALLEPLPKPDRHAYIDRMIALKHVDGAILLPPVSEDLYFINSLQNAQIPFILIESSIPDVCKIETDNYLAGKIMGEHLLSLGHTQIGYISLSPDRKNANQRYHGLRDVMQSAGLPEENLSTAVGDCTIRSGFDAAKLLLENPIKPTAIFAGNDLMAVGAMAYANEHSIKIPSELSVCGFDDTRISRVISPPLTTISQPLKQYGTLAASILLDRIKDPTGRLPHEVVEFEFFDRRSTSQVLKS